jgi:hypothetical protein
MSNDSVFRKPEVSGTYPAITDDVALTTARDDVFIVLTQAFDGHGTELVRADGSVFDGFPGVSLWIELPDGRSGEVTLSPIHGDPRKSGFGDIEDGTLCRVFGKQGGEHLEAEGACSCGRGMYHRIYLSPKLDRGEIALVCNVWGCHRSRLIDDSELLSWVDY